MFQTCLISYMPTAQSLARSQHISSICINLRILMMTKFGLQIKTRDWLWNLILGSCLLCTGRRTLCIVSDIFIDDISCSAGRAWCVKCIEPLHGLWIRQPNTDTSHHHWGLRVEEWLAWIWVSGTSGSNQWSITTLTLISIKNIYKLKLHFPFRPHFDTILNRKIG